jgi:hypothetical protein
MNTLEDDKRYALKLALEFLFCHCRDRFMNEAIEYQLQWRDYCLTMNTIVSALSREARQQRLAEERVMKRKEKNKETRKQKEKEIKC